MASHKRGGNFEASQSRESFEVSHKRVEDGGCANFGKDHISLMRFRN
ncbi:MAG TPA: hypothetical protein VJ373_06145 [Desulfatiglandales bacterium]|nr:hypothetical protein [Desulfatiglandales bacterium]